VPERLIGVEVLDLPIGLEVAIDDRWRLTHRELAAVVQEKLRHWPIVVE
jgi:hypothetical protein